MTWTVLVHLSYELKNKLKSLLLCCLLLTTQNALADISIAKVESFRDLREEVLQIISKSQKRIWLTSDFLTDGEIVTALYFAKVRKLHVFVLLGSKKVSDYRSRLNYLKQTTSNFIRPKGLRPDSPSLLYSDSRLYKIDRDLNAYAPDSSARISLGTPSELETYKKDFIHAVKHPRQAIAKPVPLVGRRSNNRKNYYKKTSGYPRKKIKPDQYKKAISPSGSYHYDRSPKSYQAPSGINTSLPQVPVYMKKKN